MLKVSYKLLEEEEPKLEVLVDEESWLLLHSRIFRPRRSLPKEAESEEELQEKLDDFERKKARNRALYYLSSQSFHSSQLHKRLIRKSFSGQAADFAISECRRFGYLNDEEWAEQYLRQLQRRRLGASQIRMRLIYKGVSSDVAEELVAKHITEEAAEESVRTLLASRYARRDLKDPKEKRKVAASLMRRGFPPSLIWEALAEALSA